MFEITKINNKIDFYIEKKYSFFINVNEWFINKTNFEKFTGFVEYAIKNKYTVIKAENKNKIKFFFVSNKANQNEINNVHEIIENMCNDSIVSIDAVSAKKIKTKNKRIKQNEHSEQWFNNM